MSGDKQRSLARRIAILIACESKPVREDRIPAKDAARLWRDNHIRKVRIPTSNGSTITVTAFEITTLGREFLKNHAPLVKTVSAEQAQRDLNRIPRYTRYDQMYGRATKRANSREDRNEIVRRSARTAAVISNALREAEANPTVLVTGWLSEQEASEHFIGKMFQRISQNRPETDFTTIDVFLGASSAVRKHLDGTEARSMNVIGIHALGGGAVLGHVESDPKLESFPLHARMYREWKELRKKDPTVQEPIYPEVRPKHCLIMLSTGEAMSTYVQMLCR